MRAKRSSGPVTALLPGEAKANAVATPASVEGVSFALSASITISTTWPGESFGLGPVGDVAEEQPARRERAARNRAMRVKWELPARRGAFLLYESAPPRTRKRPGRHI